MTIDELLTLEKKLVAQKKCELERQDPGEKNSASLERIRRELSDIRVQIQAAASAALTADKQSATMTVNYFVAKQRFFKLPSMGRPLNAKSAKAYEELQDEISLAVDHLSSAQRGSLYLALRGWSFREISEVFGIAKGTVRSRVNSAKKYVLTEAELAMTRKRLLAKGHILDMRQPDIMEAILAVMTPKQAAHFYLYYSENLTFRKIGELLGCAAGAPFESISRALRSIDILLGEQDVILEHPEVLDKLGYRVYCDLCTHPELVQTANSLPRTSFRQGREYLIPSQHAVPRWVVHVQVWRQVDQRWRAPENTPEMPHGQLLAALMESGKDMSQELKNVFSVCKYKFKQRKAPNSQ